MNTSADYWARVNKAGPVPPRCPERGPCWLWTGSVAKGGYGRFAFAGKYVAAHRFSYEEEKGPVAAGLDLDHLCHVRLCVRPSHLEPVTKAVNALRGTSAEERRMRTHCPQGHPYDEANTSVRRGRRNCKTCHRVRVLGSHDAAYWRLYRAQRTAAGRPVGRS